jgi:hypothetical protein
MRFEDLWYRGWVAILMATVALLSMLLTRTVDGQLATMPSRLST